MAHDKVWRGGNAGGCGNDRSHHLQPRPSEGELLNRCRLWLTQHSDYKFAREILALLPAANGKVNVNNEPDEGARLCELPIPMSDKQALNDYIHEYKRQMSLAAADLELGLTEQAEARKKECAAIRKHIKQITVPEWRIKNFPSSAMRDYQRNYQGFRYLLRLAKQDDPEVWRYLKAHVRTGMVFAWQEESAAPPQNKFRTGRTKTGLGLLA